MTKLKKDLAPLLGDQLFGGQLELATADTAGTYGVPPSLDLTDGGKRNRGVSPIGELSSDKHCSG